MANIRTRSEIEAKYKWRLEDIYADENAWNAAYTEAERDCAAFTELGGKVAGDPKKAIRAYFTLTEKVGKVYEYAMLRRECDNADPTAQALRDRAAYLWAKCAAACSFLEPELLAMDAGKLQALIDDADMKDFDAYLKGLLRNKPHTLPKEQEKLLAMMTELAGSPDNTYTMLTNVDMKFPDIVKFDGTHLPLSEGNYTGYIRDEDREVRRQAFEGIMNTYGSFGSTVAATYGASVKKDQTFAEARGFETALEYSLFPDEIPQAVYDNLIEAVHDALPSLQKYLHLRKEKLRLDELHMYDLYVPIISDVKMEMPYEQAFDLVLKALTPLGEDYIAKLREARDSGWIDVYPAVNKSSGAFSAGSLRDVHPYVLLNHNDNLDSAMTIAHELGHSMHSWFSNTNQPAPKSDYSLFVAEVASTCNEALMTRYLLNTVTDERTRAYILNHFLEQIRTTCFRQTMFAEFERISHDMALRGEPLTRETLCDAYYKLNERYYGPVCKVDACTANEWMRIPHFYRAFYVYVYATGICAAIALSDRILTGGAQAVADYRKFLSAGCSVPPIEALKYAGIDMSKPEPVRSALKIFAERIDELAALV